MPKNGSISEDGGQRWCGGCRRWHDRFYDCSGFGPEVLAQIATETATRESIPAEAISAQRFFAGLAPLREKDWLALGIENRREGDGRRN